MVDVYGIRIIPDDGGKPLILDAATRYASYLGTGTLPANSTAVGGFKSQQNNSKAIMVPRSLVGIYGSTSPAGPPMYFVNGLGFSGSTLSYSVKAVNANTGSTSPAGVVDVFSVTYGVSSSSSSYGLRIRNGADFMEINDTTYLGFVTYRAVINVSPTWQIPQQILNMGSYIVFARWNNTDYPLFLDRDTGTIRTYTGFGSVDGSGEGGSVTGVQIVIVSCGFSPGLPASGYGMAIRNAAGVVTFSSKYPPVMWTDAYYAFGAYENYDDSTGEVLSWTNPTGSVQQPMVPLCSLGIQRGDYSRSGSGYTYRKCLLSGLKMSGNSVSTARAKSTFADIVLYQYPKAVQVACQVPCIDAAYYF